ncbi:MAG TPA: hypothetical protein DEF34_00090 [Desulfotomaculum sp.]|nr:hypothetical protein [Desulfotomaculum sp.]
MHIFKHISQDLQQVQLLLKKNFSFRAGQLSEFVPLNFNNLDMNLRPGIVISAGSLFGPASGRLVALAAVLQFIFMASRVHSKVKEGSSGKERPLDSRAGFQYPVLVGDYLYGKFFTTLCEFGIVCYLKDLAELICQINKSGIHALRNPGMEITDRQLYMEVVQGETARLFACGAYLGADLTGAGEHDKSTLYNFGLNLGMAYGLLERGATSGQVKEYLTMAELNLHQLPGNIDTQCFRDLLELFSRENTVQRMVG